MLKPKSARQSAKSARRPGTTLASAKPGSSACTSSAPKAKPEILPSESHTEKRELASA